MMGCSSQLTAVSVDMLCQRGYEFFLPVCQPPSNLKDNAEKKTSQSQSSNDIPWEQSRIATDTATSWY